MRTDFNVALFITCLIDLFRPSAGFASVKLLEQAGCSVKVPRAQTCCGQPAYNSGDARHAKRLARQVITAFKGYDYVIVPSGSCAGMLRVHYPRLFEGEAQWGAHARDLAARTFELTSFLVDILDVESLPASFSGSVTYHDACAGLRELGVREQPRRLLKGVTGLALEEMVDTETCCGFGGTFCVKYPEISTRMVDDKISSAQRTGTDTLLAGDLGCLFNIAGRMRRKGVPMRCYHVAEILAGEAEKTPPIAGSLAEHGTITLKKHQPDRQ